MCLLAEAMGFGKLFADDLYQDSLLTSTVEFTVKNLLPSAKIQLPLSDGNDRLATHDLPLDMGIGIVLTGVIVTVLFYRLVGRQFLKPNFKIMVQSMLIIVNENRRGDVHGIDKAQTFLDTTLLNSLLDLRGEVQKTEAFGMMDLDDFPI
jgi:hypothetical protein